MRPLLLALLLLTALLCAAAASAPPSNLPCNCHQCIIQILKACGCQECLNQIRERNAIRILGCIGTGGTGVVNLGEHQGTKQLLSIKKVFIALAVLHGRKQDVLNELSVMKKVSGCDFFPMFFGVSLKDDYLFIEMEYIGGGTLYQAVNAKGAFHPGLCRLYSKQLFTALRYLHNNGYMHGDISVNNIMFTGRGTLKLIDFSHANRLNNVQVYPMTEGSLQSWAPERRFDCELMPSQDVWSAGYCLAFMATGHLPFSEDDYYSANMNMRVFQIAPIMLKSIILSCLKRDPSKRKTPQSILNESWLLELDQFYPDDVSHLVVGVVFCHPRQVERVEQRAGEAEQSVVPRKVEGARKLIRNHITKMRNSDD